MTDKDKIINLEKTKRTKEIYDLGGLLPQIFSHFAKDLKPKLIACFESLDDTFFNLAEKAESNQNQTMYFETMRNVRKKRTQMFSDFFNSIKLTFKQFKNNKLDYFDQDLGYNPDLKSLSLTLVNEKELDETLAKTNLINKSDMAYHRQLFAFEKRFSVLASGSKLKSCQIPISPHVIVNSFSKCIGQLEIDITLKLIMYKLFERNIMGQLNNVYSQINEFLANKGIVPEITYHIGQQGTKQSSIVNPNTTNDTIQTEQQLTEENVGTNQINKSTSTANQTNIDPNYQIISQLFNHSRQSPPTQNENFNNQIGGNTNNNSAVSNIDMGSMINALSSLQTNLFKRTEYINKSPTEIKQELIKQLHKTDESTIDQKVNQKDEDTIDLVGMLFQFIVDDRNLPDAIQVLLAKLQIPYLKIALKNRNVFADRNHPARELLDRLSMASVGWSEESDKKNIYLSKIEKVTHDILELDEYNREFYINQLEEFEDFLNKQKKKSDVAQRRSKEKTLGQDKINNAKEQTAQLLVDKMSDKQMPTLIRDLLLGEWASVLILMHLRYGPDSEESLQKVRFVDLIIKYSQSTTDSEVTTQMIKDVTEKYEKGLKVVAYNPKESIDKQHKLVECLNKIQGINLDSTDESQVKMISPSEILKLSDIRKQHEIVDYIEEIIEPSEDDSHEELEDKYLKLVKSMKIGTWLEFIRDENNNIRAKLSWISPITAKYLFVNSRGLKISDKSNINLAAGLKDKTIRILQQVALFDRALSSIADKLKDTEKEINVIKKSKTTTTNQESS